MMGKMVECAKCKGTGAIRVWDILGPGKEKPCPVCGGSGKVEQK